MIKSECFIYYNEPEEEVEDFIDRVYQTVDYDSTSVIDFNGKLRIFNPYMSKQDMIESLQQ